jgi:protocatechuate 3,4-dioxygenase beta subunit
VEGPDLVLHEKGVIQGRMVYPDGTPVADLDVTAYTLTYEGEHHREVLYNTDPAKRPGLPGGRTFTDAEGRFLFAGLRPGDYFITYTDAYLADENRMETFAPDTGEVRVETDLYLIRVRVLDDRGQPVPGARIRMSVKEGDRYFPRNPLVVEREDGVRIFEAYPGVTLRFSAWTPMTLPVEKEVEIVDDQHETGVELMLQ